MIELNPRAILSNPCCCTAIDLADCIICISAIALVVLVRFSLSRVMTRPIALVDCILDLMIDADTRASPLVIILYSGCCSSPPLPSSTPLKSPPRIAMSSLNSSPIPPRAPIMVCSDPMDAIGSSLSGW